MKVLLVEDDLLTAEWMTLFLQSNQIETRTADSISAVKICLMDWHPDVIVTDLTLKGENAFSLLDHLRSTETTADIPVIAVTGYQLDDSEKKKFQGYLMKPIEPEELLKLIRRFAPNI